MPERTNDIIGARYQHVDLKPFDLHQSWSKQFCRKYCLMLKILPYEEPLKLVNSQRNCKLKYKFHRVGMELSRIFSYQVHWGLFIVIYLAAPLVTHLYSVEWFGWQWTVNCSGCGKKRPWPNLRHNWDVYLDELRKTTKNVWEQRLCPGWDSNWEHPEPKPERVPTEPTYTVLFIVVVGVGMLVKAIGMARHHCRGGCCPFTLH
jgi:hypothetical protein